MNGQSHWYYFFNALVGFAVFAIIWAFAQIVMWTFYPYQTAEVVIPIEVQNIDDKISPDEEIELLLIISKASNLTPTVDRYVNCDNGQVYGVISRDQSDRVPQGEFIRRRFYKFSTPPEVGSVCYFEFNLDYQPNPIRVINRTWASEPFEIVE